MLVSKNEVKRLAQLAKLSLPEEQIPEMQKQLNSILGYMKRLNKIDTKGVQPLAHPLDIVNSCREDKKQLSLPPEQATKNAPQTQGNYFSVPRVVHK